MTKYVLGFMFDHTLSRVVLIRKSRPLWQAGKLNGVGGHIEDGESKENAMVREYLEETGVTTIEKEWIYYCSMVGKDFTVECFCGLGNVDLVGTKSDEKVSVFYTSELPPWRDDMIENLGWLIASAIDRLEDGKPSFITANYT